VRLPPSYSLEHAPGVRAAIRRDLVPELAPWLLAPRLSLPADAERLESGRGPAYRVRLVDGTRVIVRIYRLGGLVARFVHETYVGLSPRPFRELAVTVEARRRGVAAPEVIAARVEGRLVYRGALVTVEVPAAATLLDAMRLAPDGAARQQLAIATGRALATLHGAGVFHADLNVTNILVRGTDVVLLDFDRARVVPPPLSATARRRNLRRLARSVAKLDPRGELIGPDVRRAFTSAYGAPEAACAS